MFELLGVGEFFRMSAEAPLKKSLDRPDLPGTDWAVLGVSPNGTLTFFYLGCYGKKKLPLFLDAAAVCVFVLLRR